MTKGHFPLSGHQVPGRQGFWLAALQERRFTPSTTSAAFERPVTHVRQRGTTITRGPPWLSSSTRPPQQTFNPPNNLADRGGHIAQKAQRIHAGSVSRVFAVVGREALVAALARGM
jgi:hypothetical protein